MVQKQKVDQVPSATPVDDATEKIRLQVKTRYYDLEIHRILELGEVIEVKKERANVLIARKLVKKL